MGGKICTSCEICEVCEICAIADANDLIVITKDEDFRSSFFLKNSPNKLIRVVLGNISNQDLLALFEKYEFLVEIGVKSWNMSHLSENRKKQLAKFVRNNTNTDLKRIHYLRRYPMLVCFLWENLLDITDIIMTMYADYWLRIMGKTKRSLDALLLHTMKTKRQAINTLTQTSKMVVDRSVTDFFFSEPAAQAIGISSHWQPVCNQYRR